MAVVLVAAAILACCASATKPKVDPRVRRAPYPYQAALAICSDIDGSTLREFIGYHRFLNTLEETPWGKGVGLDIGDSFWMFAMNNDGAIHDYDGATNENIMTYFQDGAGTEKYAKDILRYFQAGWIDSMHSFGDFSQVDETQPIYIRDYGNLAFETMREKNLLPSIWINHGNAANLQNVRNPAYKTPRLSYQQGGDPKSENYHTDVTVAGGLKYFWFSKPFATFSQASPLFPVTLQDGQKVWGFNRHTGEQKGFGFFGKHEYHWSIYDVDQQLSAAHLDELTQKQGIAIVAQHLGTSNGDYILPKVAVDAFRLLAEYEQRNDILVARTSRLLEFVRARDYLNYTYTKESAGEIIDILTIDDPVLGQEPARAEALKGISFHVDDAQTATILIGGKAVDESLLIRSAPEAQEQVIGFQWYEKDVTDYSAQ